MAVYATVEKPYKYPIVKLLFKIQPVLQATGQHLIRKFELEAIIRTDPIRLF